jgi:hypothetical protein
MSWTPTLNLKGPPIQTGTYDSSKDPSPTIILNGALFPDNNFIVLLTPYGTPTGIPMAWIVSKGVEDEITSFTIGCSGTTEVFWAAISSNS